MNNHIKQNMIHDHYITQLKKMGVQFVGGLPLHDVHVLDLRRELALKRMVRN